MATTYNISGQIPYWNLLKGLSNEIKVALISKLSDSIATSTTVSKKKNPETLRKFYGCLKDEDFPSSEEIEKVMEDSDKNIEGFLL